MQKEKIKEYLLGGIAMFIVLFTLIVMALNLTQSEEYKALEAITTVDWHECGFTMLKFKSDLIGGDFEWGNSILGIINLLQLLAFATAIILIIISFVTAQNKMKIFLIAIGISLAFCALYMIEGIVFSLILNSYGPSYGGVELEFQTLAYIPLIVVAICTGVYFIIDKLYIVDGAEKANTVNGSNQLLNRQWLSIIK